MRSKSVAVLIFGLIITAGLDQLIKYWVYTFLPLSSEKQLLPFLSLLHARNDGIAFSMFSYLNNLVLIILTLVVLCLVLALWFFAGKTRALAQLGYVLIIGGAIGNLIDRIRFHYVVDYIYFHIGTVFQFAIFNLADSFITVGAIVVILDEILISRHNSKQNKAV